MNGSGSGPRILVVEDNPRMRAVIRSVVEPVASEVIECADGRDAVRLHAAIRPDIVLMDLEMAGMDGLTATRAIRGADSGARVIIVTEHDDDGFRRAATDAGAEGYIIKERLLELPGAVLSCFQRSA